VQSVGHYVFGDDWASGFEVVAKVAEVSCAETIRRAITGRIEPGPGRGERAREAVVGMAESRAASASI
jgi:hypothetical protein